MTIFLFHLRTTLIGFILIIGFTFRGYAQHLTISSSASSGNWSASGTNPVTITVSGTATLNISVITTYLNAGTSVIVNNGVTNGDINIDNTITATGSGSLTLTANRSIILSANISTSGTQTYNGAVLISGAAYNSARTITSTGGSLIFNSTIDANSTTDRPDLTLTATSGLIEMRGNMGAIRSLNDIVLNASTSQGAIFYGNTINLAAYTSSTPATYDWQAQSSGGNTYSPGGNFLFSGRYFSAGTYRFVGTITNNTYTGWWTVRDYNSLTTNYVGPTNSRGIDAQRTFSTNVYLDFIVDPSQSSTALTWAYYKWVQTSPGTNINDPGSLTISSGSFAFNNASNNSFATIFEGSGSIVQSGSGTLTLSGSNTYTGGTRIDAGYLTVTSSSNLGGGTTNLTFNGGGLKATNTTDFSSRFSTAAGQQYKLDANGQNVTWATTLTSSGGSLTKLGTGTLTLSAANTYTGTTTISAGTIQLGVNNALPNTSLTIDAGATLALAGFNQSVGAINGSGTISTASGTPTLTCTVNADPLQNFSGSIGPGAIALIKAGTATLTLSSGNSYTGNTSITGGKLRIENAGSIGAGTTTKTYAGNISISSGATFEYGSNIDHLFSGVISGAGSVVQSGSGTLTLSGSNTYTGGTRIDAGYVIATSSSNLGGGTTNLIFNGGGLKATNTTDLSSRFSAVAGQQYKLDANGQNVTWATALTSSGGSITKLGTGTLTLSAANTYTGTTTISAGTIQLGVNNALPNTSLTIDAGAGLALAGFNQEVGSLAGSGTINSTSGTPMLTSGGDNSSTLFSGVIGSGAISFVKKGTGVLTISGANSYTGATSVLEGTLQLGASNTIPNTALSIDAGATLQLSGYNEEVGSINGAGTISSSSGTPVFTCGGNNTSTTFAGVIGSGAISLTKKGAGTLILSGTNTYTGLTNIDAGFLQIGDGGSTGSLHSSTDVVNNASIVFNRADYIASFPINGIGSLTKLGSGTIILAANNSYSGGTTISGGTLQIGANSSTGSLGSGAVVNNANLSFYLTENYTISNSISGSGSVTKIGVNNITLSGVNTYSGGTDINNGMLTLGSSDAIGNNGTISFNGGTLKYSASNTTDYSSRFSSASNQQYSINTNEQNITFTSSLSSISGSLAKSGGGVLTLSGASTYSGTTTISGGTLQLNKTGGTSIPNTNNVIISGGTLKVSSNQVLNDLTVSSGTLEVDNNVVLTNNGIFTGGGTITNNGTIVIRGGSTFPDASTTINTMNNLTIDRAGGITLNKDLDVAGILTLSSGVLDAGTVSLTVSGSIAGASSTTYIKTSSSGVLKMPLSNGANKAFPVGNSSYNPVTIANNTNSSDDFSVRVSDAVLDGGTTGNAITDKVVNRTWHIGKTNANASPGIDMTFSWDASEEGTSMTDYKLSHFGLAWALAAGTSSSVTINGTTKTMTHTGYTGTFSPFAIGSSTSVLPVTWHSFTATEQGSGALLQWSTASEQNTKDFLVEYSTNAMSWSPIGTVAASGNSSSLQYYSMLHKDPVKGQSVHFYRIQQRDLDGKFSYSKIVRLQMSGAETGMLVYPNPAKDVINVYLSQPQELRIISITGAEVWRNKLPAGNHQIEVGHLLRGMYIVATPTQQQKVVLD